MARRRSSGGRRARDFSRGVSDTIGLPETMRQLREMGEHVVQAAKDALKQGADEVVADAKSRCPVRTGKLRDSIRAEPNRDGTVYTIIADADRNGFCYGQIVEFSPKTINGRRVYKPFLYPALEANYGRVMANIRSAVNRAAETGHA